MEANVGDGVGSEPAVTIADGDISFDSIGLTLTRSDTDGDWNDNFRIGDWVRISNLPDADDDGLFKISNLSSTVLTLSEGPKALSLITDPGVTIQKVGKLQADGAKLTMALEDASFVLDFTHDGVEGTDFITRSSGDWETDGFEAGQRVTVTGTASNDDSYIVESVDGSKLYLVNGNFTDETSATGVSVTRYEESNSMAGGLTLNFVVNPSGSDSIVRSAGEWLNDGFYSGQLIIVTGTSGNDDTYIVDYVDGASLFILDTDLSTENGAGGVSVTGYDRVLSVKDKDLELDFVHDPNGVDSIVRNDGGDWEYDGFMVGQKITVTGSLENNDTFEIKSIKGDTIYLADNVELSNEFSVTGVSIESDAGKINIDSKNSSVIVTTSLSGSPLLLKLEDAPASTSPNTQNSNQKKSFSDKALGGQKLGVQEPGKIAFNGTFSLVDIDNLTKAYIDGGFIVDSGTDINVKATDSTYLVNGSTAFAYAGDIGGAANIAINTVNRDTSSEIGNESTDSTGEVFIESDGDVNVNSKNSGGLLSVAMSGVLQQSLDKKPAQQEKATLGSKHSNQMTDQNKAKENTDKTDKDKFPTWMPEMSLSGNVSYNRIDDETIAALYRANIITADITDIEALNDAWIGSWAGSSSITASYYDNSVKTEDPQPDPPEPEKQVNDKTLRPVPTVRLLPNKQVWMSFKGKLAYWNGSTATADEGNPDKKVEGGDTDINLTEFFTRPTSASPTTTTKTFTLAVGDYDAHAVGRKKVWFTVTVEGKTYSGTDAEIENAWIADIQKAIKSAISGKKDVSKTVNESTKKTTTAEDTKKPGNEEAPKNQPVIAGAGSVSVVVNNITGDTKAFIDSSVLAIDDSLKVTADTSQVIVGVATSGSIAYTQNNSGFGVAGSATVNIISGLTESSILDSSVSVLPGGKGISVSASDNNIIGTGAGSLSITASTNDKSKSGDSGTASTGNEKSAGTSGNNTKSQAAVSVSPSAAVSIVTSKVHSYVLDSSLVSDGTIAVDAKSNETVISVASGLSGAGANSTKGSFALAGAGSASINVINAEALAYINESDNTAGRSVESREESVTITAADNSLIISNAGSIGISYAKGSEWGVGVALGAAIAVNTGNKNIRSGISGATVKGKKDVSVTAKSDSYIWALTTGGFGAGAKGTEKFAFALAAGAAGSINAVDSKVESYIENGSNVQTTNGNVSVSAEDNSAITANSLIMGVSGAVGKTSAVAVSLGGTFSVNILDKETRAYISSSYVASGGKVDLDALSGGSIWALTIGGVGAGSRAETNFGGALTVAGAGSVNDIESNVETYIGNGSTVNSGAGQDVSLTANDASTILSNSGILGVAVAWEIRLERHLLGHQYP